MAQLGADVEQMDQLSRRFQEAGAQIRDVMQQVESQLQSTWWEGNDANRFRDEWNGSYRSQLTQISERLAEAGSTVARQASEQRQASGN